MGINGLWPTIESTGTRRSFNSVIVQYGFETKKKQDLYRIGVDASIWFKQCQKPFIYAHSRAGENPELRTLFYRLARLFSLPVLVIFVFDGANRPGVKRGTKVLPNQHWLTDGFKTFVEAFGFKWHNAPGEAEAELGHMNRQGIIDAVLTDDGDAFIFGAEVIIRNPSVKTDKDMVTMFKKAHIKLTCGDLLLFALLCGGDYSQSGLSGCGPHIAHTLTHYGLGESLYAAANSLDRLLLPAFLDVWRETLRSTLRNDPKGYLGRRYPTLASAVGNDFPDIQVLDAYVHPLVSDLSKTDLVFPVGEVAHFDLGRVAQLCGRYFSWGISTGLVTKFQTLVWPGAIMRIL
ncbi:PIN domain-like protein, partial [Amylocystis lapponica]